MDRTELIEQLVVIEDRSTAREDDDAAAGEGSINDVTDSLRGGRDWNAPLVVHLAGRFLLDMRRRVRPELSRDLNGITDNVDRCFAILPQTRPARIRPDDDREPVAFCVLGISAKLFVHFELVRRSRVDREANRAAAQTKRVLHAGGQCLVWIFLLPQHVIVVGFEDEWNFPCKIANACFQEAQRSSVRIAARFDREFEVIVRIVSWGIGCERARWPMLEALIDRQDD